MMDKRSKGFAILAAAFLFGSFTGTFTGFSVPTGFLTDMSENMLGQSLISTVLFPALAVLLGTSLLGGLLLPLLSIAKGFTLSFSLSVMFSAFGNNTDKWQALKPHAVPILVSVTVLFILSTQAFYSSLTLLKLSARVTVTDRIYGTSYWINVVICALALALTAILTKSLT